MAYDNTNTGALFKNADKETDKHPDYRGNINVNGEEFWLSAWLKKSKDGKTYMSLSIKAKEQRQERAAEPQKSAPPPAADGFEDSDLDQIPF